MATGGGMAIADRALVTAVNRGIGQALVEPALRRSAKRMTLNLNRKVDISR
jgi:NAD(P)-dependent dehydrogenase (short-subunit alcohol dehydrogenase family)